MAKSICLLIGLGLCASVWGTAEGWAGEPLHEPAGAYPSARMQSEPLERARVFLAAGDFRRAIEACQAEVSASPSAASYVYLTYVYQAVDAYLEYQAAQDRWVLIEQLVRNLSGDRPDVLIDPPDVLPRIAKAIIGESLQRESDVTAAMATRLDRAQTETLWQQQQRWRTAHPDRWWHGVPPEWNWAGGPVDSHHAGD